MSQEDLTQFLKAVREAPSLQEKLRAEEADPVTIAAGAGFTITRAELIRAEAAHLQSLSDEELEQAAGGGKPSEMGCIINGKMVVNTVAY